MAQKVLIIGAGVLGQAMGRVIPKDRAEVNFWDIEPAKCPGGCQPLEMAVPAADFIFMCVPSWMMRQAVASMSQLVKPTTPVISMAKGLETPTAKNMFEVCTEALPPGHPVGIIGGAMLAYEFGSGLPAMGIMGCADDAMAANVLAIFRDSPINLIWTADAHSVAVCGVLKNIYAVVLGIGDGLGLGSNVRGWLFAQAIKEMLEIGKILKADQGVILSVAGVGDLVATGLSSQSKNHAAGVEMARIGHTSIQCEGLASLGSLMQLAGGHAGLKLLLALDDIFSKGQNVRIVLQNILYKK